MSLSTALGIAQSALLANSRQTATVSRNVTNSGNADYNRRIANLSSEAGGVTVASISRVADASLFRANLSAISSYQGQTTIRAAVDRLAQNVNGVDNASSPATAIGSLYEALQTYATNPTDATVAETAIEAARDVVRSLNSATAAIQSARADADSAIAEAVSDLNSLLADFKAANDAVVTGTIAGKDTSDALDRRDAILKQIAEYVPVSTITRDNNDIVITTASGATLFETVPREVTFAATSAYAAGTTGNSVYVDGMPLSAGTGGNTDSSGAIAAWLQFRDDIAPTQQAQLDEIARGLIEAFSETDQTGGTAPALAGLFTWNGGPALPPGGTVTAGLAGSISINAAMDSTAGGNALVLRDGGANGAAYVGNTTSSASYTDLLLACQDRLDQPIAFDSGAGAGSNASVMTYSSNSISWLEGVRQAATSAETTKEALVTRTAEALSNATGVSIDEELALLLELEHSYSASARLLSVVDEMLGSLLEAVS